MSSNKYLQTHYIVQYIDALVPSFFLNRPLILASLTSCLLSFAPVLSIYYNDPVEDLQVFIFLQTIVGILITLFSSLWLSLYSSNHAYTPLAESHNYYKTSLFISLASIPIFSFLSAFNPWFLVYFLFFRSYSLRTPFYLKCGLPSRILTIILSLSLYFLNSSTTVLFSLIFICGIMIFAFGYLPYVPYGFYIAVTKSFPTISSFAKSFLSASAFELYVAILPSLLLLIFRSIKSGSSYESFLELLAVSSALSFISTGIDTVFTKRAFTGGSLLTRKSLLILVSVAVSVFIISFFSSLLFFGNRTFPSLLFACLVSLGPLNSFLSILTRRHVPPFLLLKSVLILISSVAALLSLTLLISILYGSSLSLFILTWLLAAVLYFVVMIYLLGKRLSHVADEL